MTLVERENELKNPEIKYTPRTSGKREMLSDMWNTGRFFARDRWSSFSCAIKSRVHPEFFEGLLIGSGVRLVGKAIAGSAPAVAIGIGATAGGVTALWKEGARIAREKKAQAEGVELKDVKLDFKDKIAYWRSGEIHQGNMKRLVAATATGAAVGGVGAFIGHEVTGFIADHAGEWIEGTKNFLSHQFDTSKIGDTPLWFTGKKLADIPHLFDSSDSNPVTPPNTEEIKYVGSDSTYANIPDVGPNFSSLTGWEQAQIGQMILGDRGIAGPFDPYNLEHLKLLDEYMKANPDRYARQISQLADFVRNNNDSDIFHSVHSDLIAHGKSIKVPVYTVRFLRDIA